MSMAATMKPKASGIQGGWLSMAPQTDEVPIASSSSSQPDVATASTASWNFIGNHFASGSNHQLEASPQVGYRQRPRVGSTAATRLLPRTNARFKVGDSSAVGTPISPPVDSPYSRGSGYDSPPPFDVRASFAPMPKWGSNTAATTDNAAAYPSSLHASSSDDASDPRQNKNTSSNGIVEESKIDDSDDGLGIRHNGRQWKGKTAHAVELEMEALGDVTVMSYAPDAVYLASRLEGLRRNLEVGGDRFKRWAWEDYDESEKHLPSSAAAGDDTIMAVGIDEQEMQRGSHPATPSLEDRQMDSLVSSLAASESHTPLDIKKSPITVDEAEDVSIASSPMPIIPSADEATVNKLAKAAALDARVEVRTLRRPDLEQVRDLHCYHGSSDKVDAETYTTSAGFLLRLLVDEHHVCLVAVAKPLPEPPSLPTRFAPNAPPPSLDMPPSKSPFLLAGHTRSATPRRHTPLSHSKLAPLAHDHQVLEAPAPRSFGLGGDGSSDMDVGEEDANGQLFEKVQKSSASSTGNTSPDAHAEVDEEQVQRQSAELRETKGAPLALHTPPRSHINNSVLAGPTHDVAPPRAIRIMGAPPINGVRTDLENILGVASARIKVVRRTEGDDAFGKSEALDASWPGLDPKGQKSLVTREAHIISLSVQPGERGQGLGSRLLDHLLDECKRRTAGPRINVSKDDPRAAEMAPRVHENAPMRTFLEVHPTNSHAIELYKSRGFHQVPGSKGVVKHYFRGDNRIPNAVRVKIGGSDAIRLERFDFT